MKKIFFIILNMAISCSLINAQQKLIHKIILNDMFLNTEGSYSFKLTCQGSIAQFDLNIDKKKTIKLEDLSNSDISQDPVNQINIPVSSAHCPLSLSVKSKTNPVGKLTITRSIPLTTQCNVQTFNVNITEVLDEKNKVKKQLEVTLK